MNDNVELARISSETRNCPNLAANTDTRELMRIFGSVILGFRVLPGLHSPILPQADRHVCNACVLYVSWAGRQRRIDERKECHWAHRRTGPHLLIQEKHAVDPYVGLGTVLKLRVGQGDASCEPVTGRRVSSGRRHAALLLWNHWNSNCEQTRNSNKGEDPAVHREIPHFMYTSSSAQRDNSTIAERQNYTMRA